MDKNTNTTVQLLKVLDKIKKPGYFCTSGSKDICLPGLDVEGVGSIALPLIKEQADAIIKHCRQAPFGRGELTIVDTNIRKVWQLEPQKFQLTNPEWNTFMDDMVQDIASALGVYESTVSSHLYKLLIYEKGSFFLSHRDTEKIDDMFATCVVVLPSEHQGGTLIIRHDGQEKSCSFGGKNKHFAIHYASFYADCEHEVTKITDGYRLCLVYNLALADKKKNVAIPSNKRTIESVAKILQDWSTTTDNDTKMVVLLKHHYTEVGLSLKGLKNLDRSKAEVLLHAAEQTECEGYLSLVTLWQSGHPEESGYYSRWDDNCGDDCDDYEMEEVCDSTLQAHYWKDSNGKEQSFGKIDIVEKEIVSLSPMDQEKPDKNNYQEATGNEGASLERWYHRAAVVMWPRYRRFHILAQADQKYSLVVLQDMVKNWISEGHPAAGTSEKDINFFANEIIHQWRGKSYDVLSPDIEGNDKYINNTTEAMLNILRTIGNIKCISYFFRHVVSNRLTGTEGSDIATICNSFGWSTFKDDIEELFEANGQKEYAKLTSIFQSICCQDGKLDSECLTVCIALAKKLISAIKDNTKEILEDEEFVYRRGSYIKKEKMSSETIEKLITAIHAISQEQLLGELIEEVTSDPDKFNVRDILLPAVEKVYPNLPNSADQRHLLHLANHCIAYLTSCTATPVEQPKDWVLHTKLSCNCYDCNLLQKFLDNPNEQTHRFSLNKSRRHHIHIQIDKHSCDMTHITERKGRPFTIVCTKNRNSYERRKQQWEEDTQSLLRLQRMIS